MAPVTNPQTHRLRRAALLGGIRDERVLHALEAVDRRHFVPAHARSLAANDEPIRIGLGQTTSQPSLVARILEDLHLLPGMRVLEVGCGTGYEATLAASLVAPGGRVVTIERDPRLAARARECIDRALDDPRLGAAHIEVRTGDGALGAPDAGPFNAIIVAAATDEVPPALTEQLADLGRLIVPVNTERGTELLRFDRHGPRVVPAGTVGLVRYVPLLPGTASND
jgi:protein-L-isoaspartate(D-aspartate) O-methyltransferase